MKVKRKRRMSRRRRERTYIAVMVLLAIAVSIGLTRSVMRDDKEFEEHEQQSQEFNARMQRIDEKREAYECDGLWFNNTIVAVALFGGSRGSGSKCGLSCWNVDNPATGVNTNIVASLSCKPPVAAA